MITKRTFASESNDKPTMCPDGSFTVNWDLIKHEIRKWVGNLKNPSVAQEFYVALKTFQEESERLRKTIFDLPLGEIEKYYSRIIIRKIISGLYRDNVIGLCKIVDPEQLLVPLPTESLNIPLDKLEDVQIDIGCIGTDGLDYLIKKLEGLLENDFSFGMNLVDGNLIYRKKIVIKTRPNSSNRKLISYLWQNREIIDNGSKIKIGVLQATDYLRKTTGFKTKRIIREQIKKYRSKFNALGLPIKIINEKDGYLLKIDVISVG